MSFRARADHSLLWAFAPTGRGTFFARPKKAPQRKAARESSNASQLTLTGIFLIRYWQRYFGLWLRFALGGDAVNPPLGALALRHSLRAFVPERDPQSRSERHSPLPTTRRQLQPFAKAIRGVRTIKEKATAMLQRWSYCSGGVLTAGRRLQAYREVLTASPTGQ